MFKESTMALPHKTGVVWAEFFGDVPEAVAIVATAAIEEPCRPI
jgi:hypothetical protein